MVYKIGVGILIALMAIICGCFYAAPYITLYKFKKAVDANDVNTMSKYIDFPALRESLKNGLASRKTVGKSNPFKNLKATIVGAVADPVIDSLVTPVGIAAMIKGEKFFGQSKKEPEIQKVNKDEPKYSTAYESFNRFILKLKDKDDLKKETVFVLTRVGLFSWKLSGVRLPSRMSDKNHEL